MRRAARSLAVAACLFLAGIAAAGQQGSSPSENSPLTNVDVVRMVASGMPVERILDRIASSPAAFDVEPEILEELRFAGVPGPVLEAMIAKSRKEKAPAPAPPPPARSVGWIEVVFQDDPEKTPAANSAAAPAVVADPNDAASKKKVELAFFLICRRSTHAPDHWDAATPLSREVGRHEVLFFQAASAPAEGEKEEDLVYLPHPPLWRFEAEAGSHAGVIGVAARAEGTEKYLPVALAEIPTLVVEAGRTTRVTLSLRSRIQAAAGRGREAHEATRFRHLGTVGRRRGQVTTTIEVLSVSGPEAPPPPPS